MKRSIFFTSLIVFSHILPGQPNVNYNDVAVVINSNSQVSIDIGTYFQQQRNIPNQNMIYISSTTDELIDTNQFNLIKQQIENYLVINNMADSINYIVLTKGIPHRIERGNCDSIQTGANCTAVDAELTYLLVPSGFSVFNPYYNSWDYFSRINYGIYLVTRLDGYDIVDVLNLIDRSGPNTIVNKPSSKFIFDISRVTNTAEINLFLNFMQPPYDSLAGKGWMATLDTNYSFVSNEQNVFGYYCILHQPANISINNTWTNGSIAEILGIFSAKSFDINVNQNGYLNIADLVAEGTTGAHGYANFAFASSSLKGNILFNAYTDTISKYNLAESYYMAIINLRQDVIVGDPKTSVVIDNTVSVDEISDNPEIIIYPNPGNGIFSIDSGKARINSLKVLDVSGRIVYEKSDIKSKNNTIDLSNKPDGVYIIKLEMGGNVISKKAIKL